MNKNQKTIQQENIRTVMRAFHGCRKNCAECREEELAEEKENQPLNNHERK